MSRAAHLLPPRSPKRQQEKGISKVLPLHLDFVPWFFDPSTVDHVAGRESSSIMHSLFWAHRLERDNASRHQKVATSCEDIPLFSPILLPDQVEGNKTSG
jgi:hypothetical protein